MPEPLADPNVRLLALVDLLLVLKMIALGSYTSFLRLRRRVYATPEDYALRAATPPAGPDEDIERVRRRRRSAIVTTAATSTGTRRRVSTPRSPSARSHTTATSVLSSITNMSTAPTTKATVRCGCAPRM